MGTMVPGTLLILLAASQGQTQTCPGGLTDTSGVTRKDI
uniref:Histocompatibility 2, T region locus 3 n=1 Tax=Mus musculus TaxID=10090 RepID=S4R2A2_MOUSE